MTSRQSNRTEDARQAARERMRRLRARRRADIVVVRDLEIPGDVIEALIDNGRLAAWDSNNATAIRRVIIEMLGESASFCGDSPCSHW